MLVFCSQYIFFHLSSFEKHSIVVLRGTLRYAHCWLIALFYHDARRRLFSINLNCRIIIKREKYITANQTL
jgi:hypothetical protein